MNLEIDHSPIDGYRYIAALESVRKVDKPQTVSVTLSDPQLGDYRPFVWFESSNPNNSWQAFYETDPEDMMKMAKDINDWIGAE